MFDAILVPRGAEYQAVCRGLSRVNAPPVFPVPAGVLPITQYLKTWVKAEFVATQPRILLMGLCGSLSPQYGVGDIVLYKRCLYGDKNVECGTLTDTIGDRLSGKVYPVTALTSDRLIHLAAEKRQLGQLYQADVVDMEGFAVWEVCSQFEVSVAMLRVVSDDCLFDIPNLSAAFNPDGSLGRKRLAIALLRQPLAAVRLIRGSLQGLKVLQNISASLWTESHDIPLS